METIDPDVQDEDQDQDQQPPENGTVFANAAEYVFLPTGEDDSWLTAGEPPAHALAAAISEAVPEAELLVGEDNVDAAEEDGSCWMYPMSVVRGQWGVTPDHVRACVQNNFEAAGDSKQECEAHGNRVVPPGCSLLAALIHCSTMFDFDIDLCGVVDTSAPSCFYPRIAVPVRFAHLLGH